MERSKIFYILVAAFFVCSFAVDHVLGGRFVILKALFVDLPYKVIEGIIKGTEPDIEHEQQVFQAGVGVGALAATTGLLSPSGSATAATSGLAVSDLGLWVHLATVVQRFARGAAARRHVRGAAARHGAALAAVARAEAQACAPSSPVRVERSVAVVSPTPSM